MRYIVLRVGSCDGVGSMSTLREVLLVGSTVSHAESFKYSSSQPFTCVLGSVLGMIALKLC